MGPTTILLRPPVTVLKSTYWHILPWFFSQSLPQSDGPTPGSPLAVRIQTHTDPIQHLRSRKHPAFDGKGLTLERRHQEPDMIIVDHKIELTITDFQMHCPGFYGTVKQLNLNLLLSERHFSANIADPEKLWRIMYECFCCESFNDRQVNDDNLKRTLFKQFFSTRAYECRHKLKELEEQLVSTCTRKVLEGIIESMVHDVRRMQVKRYEENIKCYRQQLRMVDTAKRDQIAIKTTIESEIDFESSEECAQLTISDSKNDLESMLHISEIELNESNHMLEQCQQYEAFLKNLLTAIHTIEGLVNKLTSAPNCAFDLEKARCAIENNRSLQVLTTVPDMESRTRYISDLKQQHQALSSRVPTAHREIEVRKEEMALKISQMQQMRDHISTYEGSTSTTNRGLNLERILCQLEKSINRISNQTIEIVKFEKQILDKEKLAWSEYMHISSIPYDELVSIAAAKCALEKLRPEVQDDFEGFIFERALEVNGPMAWIEGFSCIAIFKSIDAAKSVQQVMLREHNVDFFRYNVLERVTRSVILHKLGEGVPSQRTGLIQGNANMSYEELASKVNVVVNHLQRHFQLKCNLKLVRESNKRHELDLKNLLDDLHRLLIEKEVNVLSVLLNGQYQDLPKLIKNMYDATNKHQQLKAREESLKNFIEELETDNTPWEHLTQELQLSDKLENAIKQQQVTRKRYFDDLKKLTDRCDAFQMDLDRNAELRWMNTSSSGIYEKLVAHWTTCADTLQRSIRKIQTSESVSMKSIEMEQRLDASEKVIRSLSIKENNLSEKLKASQQALAEFLEEYPPRPMQTRFTGSTQASHVSSVLLAKISQTQKKLQPIPPAHKPEEIVRLKNKIKILKALDKLQSSFRELYLNNILLLSIDKVNMRKLQQLCKLVATASDDLTELGGTVKVFFNYIYNENETSEYDRRMSLRQTTSFEFSKITAVNFTILDSNGIELDTVDEDQRQLAFLLIFISFLYVDGCKLFVIDSSFQDIFTNGLQSMIHLFKTHFPNMQFVILANNA
ncbi:uncharacterized protein LOC131289327 [Anopheles ziemanni]|uniref:uncharacterized protein LOC131260340 n=1 Tax=Anopheles coustani TaxID=139045 RepID=UPI002659E741|nr:uncharacterized protein LOC131260340 [Anopheles coustani]XP_058174541.1 uncharacterized protein LOC131289327 [Anopheles ziemanni]